MRIFVVENHRDTLKYLKMYLESLGHTVTTASTMQAALAASPTEDCHVLISDLGLPDGDGWQLLEQAKFPQPVYAVAMSGFASANDIARSKAAGFQRHIAKPFGEEDIIEALEEAARHIGTRPPEMQVAAPTAKGTRPPKDAPDLTPGYIADRLHDSACQSISGSYLLLCLVREQLANEASGSLHLLDTAISELNKASGQMTALMDELRSAGAEDGAAKSAITSGGVTSRS